MNQILNMLYEAIKDKLEDDSISIPARNTLVEIKMEMKEMLKKELILDDLPEVERKVEIFTEKIKEIMCSETEK